MASSYHPHLEKICRGELNCWFPLKGSRLAGKQSFLYRHIVSEPIALLYSYYSVVPLDSPTQNKDSQAPGMFGYRNWVYKAFSEHDSKPYILRRLEGFRLTHESAMAVVEKWRRIRHPNIVSVREAFTTKAFGDACE